MSTPNRVTTSNYSLNAVALLLVIVQLLKQIPRPISTIIQMYAYDVAIHVKCIVNLCIQLPPRSAMYVGHVDYCDYDDIRTSEFINKLRSCNIFRYV